jgi:uncharacterized protein YjbI with pentapeptide repeats
MAEKTSVLEEQDTQTHEPQLPKPHKSKNHTTSVQHKQRRSHRKELREWISIIVQLAGVITVVISLVGLIINVQQFNQQQQAADHNTLDQRRQATLDTYIDQMSTLLLQYNLAHSKSGDPARAVAQARTYTALRNLDPERQGTLIRFLWEAKLINGSDPIIPLNVVDITNADLSNAYLGPVSLSNAHFDSINLSGAISTGANFHDSDLTGADLAHTHLDHANLGSSHLIGANLTLADLTGANITGEDTNLTDAILIGARLVGADLAGTNLTRANLSDANLTGANLADANLTNANLSGVKANLARANLSDADLAGANLADANLTDANLTGANLKGANLKGATLTGAIMPDGSKHP